MPRASVKGLERSSSKVRSFRLPESLADAWDRYSQEHGPAAAEAVRERIAELVGYGTSDVRQQPVFGESSVVEIDKKVASKVMFTKTEREALAALAEARGCTIQFLIVSLVRNELIGSPVFGHDHLEELGRSNYQLMAIGRNLNQITHQINSDPAKHMYRITLRAIEDLGGKLEAHRRLVHKAVSSASHRWKIEVADNGG